MIYDAAGDLRFHHFNLKSIHNATKIKDKLYLTIYLFFFFFFFLDVFIFFFFFFFLFFFDN